MEQRVYNTVTAVLFAIVALAHLLRIVFGWTAQIGGQSVPLWLSWLALIVTGALAYCGFKLNTRL